MSVYSPFQLSHAHLPAPSNDDALEVTVPSERPFPETTEPYTSPLNADHAVGAAVDAATGVFARAIYNGYALELRSLSPVIAAGSAPQQHTAIRIMLPDQLRPLANNCIVPSNDGRLYVVVVSQANVVYRLEFALGSFADAGDRITFNPKHDWCEEWEVNEELVSSAGEVGSWSVVNEDTVVLGCGDGGIIQVVRSPNSTSGELSDCRLS